MAEMQKTPTGSVPVPDPTVLTTASLLREVAAARELFDAKFAALNDRMTALHGHMSSLPVEREQHILSLRELTEERFKTVEVRFNGITTQFHERDTRVDQTARASKEALDAALQAAKEAVGKQNDSFVTSIAKSETATAKQIDLLLQTANASATATNEKIEDIKTRLAAAESAVITRHDVGVDNRAAGTSLTSVIGVSAAIILGALSLMVTAYHVFHGP